MQNQFILKALRLARDGMEANQGGPFGAIIVKNGEIVGCGNNRVTSTNDCTAHAEMVAIRDACQNLHDFSLKGCEMYVSCEPCPMCLSAIYWAHIDKVYFASMAEDAAEIGFDDAWIAEELGKPMEHRTLFMQHVALEEAEELMQDWQSKPDKIEY